MDGDRIILLVMMESSLAESGSKLARGKGNWLGSLVRERLLPIGVCPVWTLSKGPSEEMFKGGGLVKERLLPIGVCPDCTLSMGPSEEMSNGGSLFLGGSLTPGDSLSSQADSPGCLL